MILSRLRILYSLHGRQILFAKQSFLSLNLNVSSFFLFFSLFLIEFFNFSSCSQCELLFVKTELPFNKSFSIIDTLKHSNTSFDIIYNIMIETVLSTEGFDDERMFARYKLLLTRSDLALILLNPPCNN